MKRVNIHQVVKAVLLDALRACSLQIAAQVQPWLISAGGYGSIISVRKKWILAEDYIQK
jgi:hypothetical protein